MASSVVVCDRIDEYLVDQRRTASITRHQSDHGSEIATCAITSNSYPPRVTVKCGTVFDYPVGCLVAILCCGRELVLRGKTIINRDRNAAYAICERTTDSIVYFKVTNHPASAMEKDEYGKRSSALRNIYAQWYGCSPYTTGYLAVFKPGNWL
jgi:hypothetical protein